MGLGKTLKRGARKATKSASKTANKAAKKITKAVNTAAKQTTKAVKDLKKDLARLETETTNAVNRMNRVALRPAQKAMVNSINEAAKQANVASKELTAGAKIAGDALEKGAETVAEGAVAAGEWIEENACNLGVGIALSTAFGVILYRPEPSSQAQTSATMAPLSGVAITYLAAKEAVEGAVMGEACNFVAQGFVEIIWQVPEVKKGVGKKNKEILTYAIAFTIAKSIDKYAGAYVLPQSGAAVVAGIVTSITTNLICSGKLPRGAREWGMTGADGL